MCNCEHCRDKGAGVIFCERFRLFGTGRLTMCMVAEAETNWTERLNRIPPEVRQRERERFFF